MNNHFYPGMCSLLLILNLHSTTSRAQVYNSGDFYNGGNVFIPGDISNNGNTSAGVTGNIVLGGSSQQTISGSSTLNTTNVNFSNNTGIILSNTLNVAGTAQFTGGIITALTQTTPLEFGPSGNYTGASDAAHVNGWVRRLGTGSFTYPVGDAVKYQKEDINLITNTAGMAVRYYGNDAGTGTYSGGLLHHNGKEYWENTPAGTASGAVTIYWDTYNNPGISPASFATDLRVAHFTGGSWVNEGSSNITGTGTSGSVTSNTVSSWSPFALGSITNASPLPVVLSGFDVVTENCTALLSWQTSWEKDCNYFTVEHSNDGSTFQSIGSVQSSRSITGSTYHFSYMQRESKGYYRLRIVNTDGSSDVSKTLTAVTTCNIPAIRIYPNPATNTIYISGLSTGSQVRIYDMTGRMLRSKQAAHDTEQLDIATLPPGILAVTIQAPDGQTQQAMITKMN